MAGCEQYFSPQLSTLIDVVLYFDDHAGLPAVSSHAARFPASCALISPARSGCAKPAKDHLPFNGAGAMDIE